MSLLDEIQAEVTGAGPRCTVHQLIEILTPEDRADLERAFGTPSIPSSAIHRALRKAGHTIGPDTIQRHRRGTCACPR